MREAVCAFANDPPGHAKPGAVFIGAQDDGSPGRLTVTDQLLLTMAVLKSDGGIVPQRRQRAIARLSRVRSALTLKVKRFVSDKARVLTDVPAEASGQLLFLGFATPSWTRPSSTARCNRWCCALMKS